MGDAEREAWHQREPKAGRYERLGDEHVLGFVHDPRLESGLGAGALEHPAVAGPGAVARRAGPALVGETAQVDGSSSREPARARQDDHDGIIEQGCALESGRARGGLGLVEEDRDVGVAGSEQARRLAGLGDAESELDAGWSRWKAARAGPASGRLALGKLVSRSRPRETVRNASRPASSEARPSKTGSASSIRVSPASVSRTGRTPRSMSVTPTSRSSALICCETADWVYPSASAAAAKDRRRPSWRRVSMRRTSSISSS
jgi:hypothetical protein